MLVRLIPLAKKHVETVRIWRNLDFVREMMEYKNIISPQEQLIWFEQLNRKKNNYFIIADGEELVGLIHLKNITNVSAEAGLFIGNMNYIGTGITYLASIEILKKAFYELKLTQIFAKVNIKNEPAIRYNESIGFVFCKKLNDEFNLMVLLEENFAKNHQKIVRILK